MLSEEKTLALHSFLGVLPGPMAARLARIIEIDRLNAGNLPHEEILDFLRPALRKYGERKRLPTPLRYFCLPFEDFLFSGRPREKRKGCISRSVIVPLWNWLGRNLIPDETAAFTETFKTLVLADDLTQCEILAAGYWKAAAAAIVKTVLIDPNAVRDYFQSDHLFADVGEISLLLSGGPVLLQIKALFPKPAPEPNEETMTAFRTIYEQTEAAMPDLAPYLPVAAMGRLEKSWQALRLASTVTRQQKETLIAATDIGLVGEILFSRMEDAKTAIVGQRHPDFDPDVLLDNLTEFTLLSTAVTKEVDILKSGIWGKRLLNNRTIVSAIMDSYMEHAMREISAVIPLKSNATGAMTLVPNFTKEVSPKLADRAKRYARLLAGCRYLASPAVFVVKYDTAMRSLKDLLNFYNEAILSELRARQWPNAETVESRFEIAIALTRELFGAEDAAMLQRRGSIARS